MQIFGQFSRQRVRARFGPAHIFGTNAFLIANLRVHLGKPNRCCTWHLELPATIAAAANVCLGMIHFVYGILQRFTFTHKKNQFYLIIYFFFFQILCSNLYVIFFKLEFMEIFNCANLYFGGSRSPMVHGAENDLRPDPRLSVMIYAWSWFYSARVLLPKLQADVCVCCWTIKVAHSGLFNEINYTRLCCHVTVVQFKVFNYFFFNRIQRWFQLTWNSLNAPFVQRFSREAAAKIPAPVSQSLANALNGRRCTTCQNKRFYS